MGERNLSKMEQALEIQSLRRVIAAYFNYSTAAEEDIKRWERSYEKLPPRHKELLPHLPKKYEALRRCILDNNIFILNMLEMFEPPFDMSQGDEMLTTQNHVSGLGNCGGGNANFIDTANNRNSKSALLNSGSDLSAVEPPKQKEEGTVGVEAVDRKMECVDRSRFSQNNAENHTTALNANVGNEAPMDLPCWTHDPNSVEVGNSAFSLLQPSLHYHVPSSDVDKVRCIIRNIVRDWAQEGAREREQCYKPILEELELRFPHRSKERPPCCLVPGAGLGRLATEVSLLGFESQGNEFSYYMLICSSFILNCTQRPLEWVIHPWIHSNCNMVTDDDQLRPVSFPDLHPGSCAGITGGFSMCAGDFVEVYSHPSQIGSWDAVATCFFIDTAHNIVEYIEIIARILKPGGVWINVGPLLYHFADSYLYSPEEEMSMELSLEDIKRVACHYGLKLQKERYIETTYTANPKSMMQNRYNAIFWSMTKEGENADNQL